MSRIIVFSRKAYYDMDKVIEDVVASSPGITPEAAEDKAWEMIEEWASEDLGAKLNELDWEEKESV